MLRKYHNLISILEPFIITSPRNQISFNSVLGIPINKNLIFNPLSTSSTNFINKVYQMDQMTFGTQGMGMDKWVFFDCSAMPGAVFGYAIHSSKLSKKDQQLLSIGNNEYFPLSMYIAIPTLEKDTWFGHNLSSLNKKLEIDLSGLGLLTKCSALETLRIKKLNGATQWNSPALYIHLKIAEIELLSSFTPIHDKENTLCYSCNFENVESILSGNCKQREFDEVFEPNLVNIK
jgi:hypothetical protein